MDCLTSGNSCINEGISLVAWGAFLVSLGWLLVGKYRAIDRGLSRVRFFRKIFIQEILEILIFAGICASIIIGLKNIGKGSILTTKGWNLLNNYEQKKALIRALAREWLVNELYQHIEPLSFDPNDPNLGEKRIIYLPFKTFASNSVLTSHLFDLQDKDERELCRTTCLYEINATTCNIMFTLLDWDLTREGTAKERRKEVYQQVVRYNRPYREFKESHEKLRKILKEKYKWALEEAKPLVEAAKIWVPSE